MKFCERPTIHSAWETKLKHHEWYESVKDTITDPIVWSQTTLEHDWCQAGRPYYSVYPVIAEALQRVRLDLPCSLIKPPLREFLIRFAEPGLPIGGRMLRSILVGEQDVNAASGPCSGIAMYADFGETRPLLDKSMPIFSFQVFGLEEGLTVEQAISPERFTRIEQDTPDSWDVLAEVVRIVCGVCLVCKDPDLVLPDVLNRHSSKYAETLEESYVQTAQRRGKIGWLIGRDVEAIPHYRRPHLGLRWTGPGRTIPRIVPIKGAIVHRQALESVDGRIDEDEAKREKQRREHLAMQLIATQQAIRERS